VSAGAVAPWYDTLVDHGVFRLVYNRLCQLDVSMALELGGG